MYGFWVREGATVRLITPYDPEFVNGLKERIPWRYRTYDPEAKQWIVRAPYVDDALGLASATYDSMIELFTRDVVDQARRQGPGATPPPTAGGPHDVDECVRRVRQVYQEESALHLLPEAPWKVVQAAYRAIAMLVHPDVSGSSSQAEMVRVNRAYEALERRQRGRVPA
jgi:hypothetical protein